MVANKLHTHGNTISQQLLACIASEQNFRRKVQKRLPSEANFSRRTLATCCFKLLFSIDKATRSWSSDATLIASCDSTVCRMTWKLSIVDHIFLKKRYEGKREQHQYFFGNFLRQHWKGKNSKFSYPITMLQQWRRNVRTSAIWYMWPMLSYSLIIFIRNKTFH